jgi:hypothetical protein
MRLYYMTSHEVATKHILTDRRMKLSRFHELNDPFELKPHSLADKEMRKITRIFQREYFPHKGVLCFSDNWRSPVMWAHYAEKHRGICLGFDVGKDDSSLVCQVEYNPKRVKFLLDREKESYGLDEHFVRTLIYTKAQEWSYEREWRAIATLEERDPATGYYFVDFGQQLALREVILGCRNETPVDDVAKLIRENDAPVRVFKARPALKQFAMVENKLVKAMKVLPGPQR